MPQPTIHAGCCVDLITLIFMSKASGTCILHYCSIFSKNTTLMTEPTQKVQKPSNSKTLKLKTKIYSLLQQSHCQSTPGSLLQQSHCQSTPGSLLQQSHCQSTPVLSVLLAATLLLHLAVHYASTCIFGCREFFSTVDCWI